MFRNHKLQHGNELENFESEYRESIYAATKRLFNRKIQRAFRHFDLENSGILKLATFKRVLSIINVRLEDDEIRKVFDYVDFDKSGKIDCPKLRKFVQTPFHAGARIRFDMLLNVSHPLRFKRYHTYCVQSRPLTCKLLPGANYISAYFHYSWRPDMWTFLRKGSCLTFINDVRVDKLCFWEINRTLDSIECPFFLTFQNVSLPDVDEFKDQWGNVKLATRLLTREEYILLEESWSHVNFKKAIKDCKKHVNQWHDHCDHCPSRNAWYLNIHLFMDDENFSAASAALMRFIMFLISISTATYILETIPGWEDWSGWQHIETIVSMIFLIEFLIRVSTCRNVSTYMKDTFNLIDFCAVVPFWIELITAGWLNPQMMRMFRTIRLLRLIRIETRSAMIETIRIMSQTITSVLGWLTMFIGLMVVTMIILAAIQFFCEEGVERYIGVCDKMVNGIACFDSNISESFITSLADCRWSCIEQSKAGCCMYNERTGNCQFNSVYFNLNSSHNDFYWAALCGLEEEHFRRGELVPSPFETIPHVMWWVEATVNLVGYGEIVPTSCFGRIMAVISCIMGVIFMSLPIMVVGSNFTVGLRIYRNRRSAKIHNIGIANIGNVLKNVNEFAGADIFKSGDERTFLENKVSLTSKRKLEQILKFENGWLSLPFACDSGPDVPKISQFSLFTLYGIFGKRYRSVFEARKRYIKSLKNWKPGIDNRDTDDTQREKDLTNDKAPNGLDRFDVSAQNCYLKESNESTGTASSDSIVALRLGSSQTVGKEMTVLPQGRGNIKARSRRVAL